ncbi:hypothetical protein [Massilia glaciei]|uniref:hypothetical protein n=1 Tax=Massilia glaciei TaxID=1524097 RepID=UPI0011B1D1CF|nr:hypothetical protein [Massilia glaciei]
MSLTIFAIAVVPAVIVYVVGMHTNNKAKTTIAAIAMALLGLFTGNPGFIITDLLCVGVAYLLITESIDSRSPKNVSSKPVMGEVALIMTNAADKAKQVLIAIITAAVGLVIAFFSIYVVAMVLQQNFGSQAPATPATSIARPEPATSSPTESMAIPDNSSMKRRASSSPRKSGDLRHCLNLANDAAVARCAAQGK